MISTHNHVDMAASLVGAGAGQADTTAAHPGKQLPRPGDLRAGIDGRAARGLGGAPAPPDLHADLGWPGSRSCVGAGAAEPCGPRPASPAQPYRPAPQERRTQQATPDATTARPTGEGYGEAEKSLPCLGGGTIQAWLC